MYAGVEIPERYPRMITDSSLPPAMGNWWWSMNESATLVTGPEPDGPDEADAIPVRSPHDW